MPHRPKVLVCDPAPPRELIQVVPKGEAIIFTADSEETARRLLSEQHFFVVLYPENLSDPEILRQHLLEKQKELEFLSYDAQTIKVVDSTAKPPLENLGRFPFQLLPLLLKIVFSRRELSQAYQHLQDEYREFRRTSITMQNLIAIFAHELGGPLTAIHTNAMLLGRYELSPEETTECVTDIQKSGEKITDLRQKILDLHTAIYQRPPIETVCIKDLVHLAVQRMESLAAEKNITMALSLDITNEKFLMASGDLETVLEHLLDNAIKYSPEGKTVCLEASRKDQELVISVRDEGAGITSDEQEKIFRAFYRSPRTAVLAPGAGLGLSLVKRICRKYNIGLQFESRENLGSVFSLFFYAKNWQ